jgi:hypothetical protein
LLLHLEKRLNLCNNRHAFVPADQRAY